MIGCLLSLDARCTGTDRTFIHQECCQQLTFTLLRASAYTVVRSSSSSSSSSCGLSRPDSIRLLSGSTLCPPACLPVQPYRRGSGEESGGETQTDDEDLPNRPRIITRRADNKGTREKPRRKEGSTLKGSRDHGIEEAVLSNKGSSIHWKRTHTRSIFCGSNDCNAAQLQYLTHHALAHDATDGVRREWYACEPTLHCCPAWTALAVRAGQVGPAAAAHFPAEGAPYVLRQPEEGRWIITARAAHIPPQTTAAHVPEPRASRKALLFCRPPPLEPVDERPSTGGHQQPPLEPPDSGSCCNKPASPFGQG